MFCHMAHYLSSPPYCNHVIILPHVSLLNSLPLKFSLIFPVSSKVRPTLFCLDIRHLVPYWPNQKVPCQVEKENTTLHSEIKYPQFLSVNIYMLNTPDLKFMEKELEDIRTFAYISDWSRTSKCKSYVESFSTLKY